MSELQRRIQKRDLKRKAKAFYRAMKESLYLKHMFLNRISDIDQRGDHFWSQREYELADGWGFRLFNDLWAGQSLPIEARWIANFATGNSKPKKAKRSKRRTKNEVVISTQRDSSSVKHHTILTMPEEPAAQGKLWTAENFVKTILISILGAWFCAFCVIMIEL